MNVCLKISSEILTIRNLNFEKGILNFTESRAPSGAPWSNKWDMVWTQPVLTAVTMDSPRLRADWVSCIGNVIQS